VRHVFASMLIFLIAQSEVGAADFVKGLAAYDRGDYTQAFEEFRSLADQGNAKAQFNLGLKYYKGEGVARDLAKAADQGNAKAQFNLGLMYYKGRGVARDHVQAYMWFNIAAVGGVDVASKALDSLEKKMIPEQISKAQALTGKWLADHGRAAS